MAAVRWNQDPHVTYYSTPDSELPARPHLVGYPVARQLDRQGLAERASSIGPKRQSIFVPLRSIAITHSA